MPFLFIYLLKMTLSLAVVFLFYHFVLRKLTFYNWNRWYLLGYSLLSFLIPFIDISKMLEQQDWAENSIVQWVPVIQTAEATIQSDGTPHAFSAWSLISLLIMGGMAFMLVRLLIRFISFHRMVKKAEPLAIGSLAGSRMKLYQVDENIIPFSFGNAIFINHRMHTREELQEIVWHEFIHVKQKHSLDIIFGELLCLLNWYNPFAWLLRRSIRENLEFIADHQVLENGISRKEYQYLLLKVTGNHHFSIAPKFNFSSLKKRIAMMNKMKSAGVHLVKFLFILPLVAVLLVAFRGKYQRLSERVPRSGNTINDTIPLTERTIPIRKIPVEIASISVQSEKNKVTGADPLHEKPVGKVLIKRKDGKTEHYDLENKESMIAFENKYGVKLEEILPPPPPPPPAPLEKNTVPPAPPKPPVPPNNEQGSISTAPAARNNGNEINLWSISHDYEITDKKAVIKLKNGTVEKYDLVNPEERSVFENKYGKIISNSVHPATVAAIAATPANYRMAPVAAVSGISSATAVTPVPGAPPLPDDYSYVISGKEDIIITITNKTTRRELDGFISQMKEKGVELDFDEIDYNESGALVSINGTMRSGNSRSNFSANRFNRLILAMIKKGDKTYFKVSTRDNKEVI